MSLDRAFWRWTTIGVLSAVFLVWAQANAVGGMVGMLQVGETSALRPLIEHELGEIPLADGPGHDGQIFYAIGLDLNGDDVGPLLDHASYRYRRILYPLVASSWGLFGGSALLVSMVVINILAFGFSAGLVASWAERSGLSHFAALVVVLNPGLWLSVQLLTSDILAVFMMITGLRFIASRKTSAVVIGFSALAKDVFLATPIPLSVEKPRSRWLIAAIPVAALVTWMLVLEDLLGEGFASRGNLDWPFAGIADASNNWGAFDLREWIYVGAALGIVLIGIVFSLQRTWLRWPIAAWTTLAIVSSDWVWDFGNNAVRAFAPIAILVVLSRFQAGEDASLTDSDRLVGTS